MADTEFSFPDYLAEQTDSQIRQRLQRIKQLIDQEFDNYELVESWSMPTFKVNGHNTAHLNVSKHHIGLFLAPKLVERQAEFLERHGITHTKSSVHLDHNSDLNEKVITTLLQSAYERDSRQLTAGLPAPARRALEAEGITTMSELESYTNQQLLELHGVGPKALRILGRQ